MAGIEGRIGGAEEVDPEVISLETVLKHISERLNQVDVTDKDPLFRECDAILDNLIDRGAYPVEGFTPRDDYKPSWPGNLSDRRKGLLH